MESAQNDSISDDPIEVSTRQQLVELSAKFGHAEQMIASLINEKRNLVAELETQRRQLNVQQKRIDEIQAYGANVAKNATRLKSVIKEILPTLATPMLLNEITETQKSTPPASPVKRTPIIHLDFTPSQLMQAKQKNEVTARMLEFCKIFKIFFSIQSENYTRNGRHSVVQCSCRHFFRQWDFFL